MKRNPTPTLPVFAALMAVALLMALPASAASPFGNFDGQVPDGVDGFLPDNAATGVVRIAGWALDDDGVAAVDVYVDGVIAGRANYGQIRPDVAAVFPGFPDSDAAGFGFRLDTSRYVNGLHTVNVLVISENGERRFLDGRVFQFVNTTANLVPFGRIEFPLEDAELYGNCVSSDDERDGPRLTVISGYALDVGKERHDMGVGYVELLLDGSILARSTTDCFFLAETGGLTNCYGLRRMDIERRYPLLRDSPHAGFRFVVDVGSLIDFGWLEGRHTFTIRAGDISGQFADIDEIPVLFRCDDRFDNESSFGAIDLPLEGLFFGGAVTLTGHAIDWEGVQRVEVYVDGQLLGNADYGILRPAIQSRFPSYPDADGAGWTFVLDTTRLANGFHELQVIVVDLEGASWLIGERKFNVVNAN